MEGLESFFTSGQQMNLFVMSCLFGIPIGIAYDIFRVLRITIHHGKIAVIIEDILFFMLYGVFIMSFTITAARSEFRFFYCIGNLLGFILYFVTIGSAVTKLLHKIIEKLKRVLRVPIKNFVLICKKNLKKFSGSLQNIKFNKKNIETPLIDDSDLLYNSNMGINKNKNKRKNVKKIGNRKKIKKN